jgi:uncharacterized iron-regulated membrane protein
MTVRQLVLKVHLWLSLAFALVILVACVTGAVLVYRHPIDRALNPALYEATTGDVGWDAVWNAVRTQYPSTEGALIRGPLDRHVYQVEIGDELLPFSLHVDPGTGRILGARSPEQSFVGWLFLLHFNLFAGEPGHTVIGTAGIVLVLITLTGVWLWWPTLRRLPFDFTVRWRRPLSIVNYDLHRVIGIVSLPLVFIIALTGAMLVFYEVGSQFVHALFLTTPARETLRASAGVTVGQPQQSVTLNHAAAVAARQAAGAIRSSMYVSASPDQPIRVWLRTPGDVRPNVGSWSADVDRRTGAVVSSMVPSNTSLAAHVDETWVIALHFGSFGGELVQVVYVVGGLTPVVLLITGTTHWLLRRRRSRARAMAIEET